MANPDKSRIKATLMLLLTSSQLLLSAPTLPGHRDENTYFDKHKIRDKRICSKFCQVFESKVTDEVVILTSNAM